MPIKPTKLNTVQPQRISIPTRELRPMKVSQPIAPKNEKNVPVLDKNVEIVPMASSLEGKFIHVKVGDKSWDAQMVQAECNKVEEYLRDLIEGNGINCLVFVTHWAVEVNILGGNEQSTKT